MFLHPRRKTQPKVIASNQEIYVLTYINTFIEEGRVWGGGRGLKKGVWIGSE